jgi:hypothetical protein
MADKKDKRDKLMQELGELNYKAIGIKQAMVAIEKRVAEVLLEIQKLN